MERKNEDEGKVGEPDQNWSEAVEDLVAAGETDEAVSLLETVVSKLETLTPSETSTLQLASALTELASLHSSKGFSLKSDELLSRATILKQRALHSCPSRDEENVKRHSVGIDIDLPISDSALRHDNSVLEGSSTDGNLEKSSKLPDDSSSPCNGSSLDGDFEKLSIGPDVASAGNVSSDDDWEAIADRAPDELIPTQSLPSVSSVATTVETKTKRRGRGTFSYRTDELYSDRQLESSFVDDVEDEELHASKQNTEPRKSKYGTRHVLVLADFPPSTSAIELEKLFVEFGDNVVIRWVNDTTALAVFREPSIALEAHNRVQCRFTMRFLDEDDILLSSIKTADLEPPRRRPQTSARTAQRLIAHGMGIKLPSTFGSRGVKAEEAARKNRILTRQKLKHDAWGDDDKK